MAFTDSERHKIGYRMDYENRGIDGRYFGGGTQPLANEREHVVEALVRAVDNKISHMPAGSKIRFLNGSNMKVRIEPGVPIPNLGIYGICQDEFSEIISELKEIRPDFPYEN